MTNRQANIFLRRAREARQWNQADLAEKLGVTPTTVGRWERGDVVPTRHFMTELSHLFGKTPQELGFFSNVSPQKLSSGEIFSIIDPMIPLPSRIPLIGRHETFSEIKQHLLADGTSQVALHGLPGAGKTALAIALAYDFEIRRHFSDGILWAGMGPTVNTEGILSRWSSFFGVSAHGLGSSNRREIWVRILRELIGQHRLLIVLDDAWNLEDALALKVGGENCAYVLTTRLPALAAEFALQGARQVIEMGEEESIQLLNQLAPELTTTNMEIMRTLARVTGGLPLALTLAGKYLHVQAYQRPQRRLQTSIERLLNVHERLSLSQPTTFIEHHPGLPIGSPLSLQTLIAVSDERLDILAQSTLRALSVFPPKPNTFSEEVATVVAACTLEALDALTDAGLLESSGPGRYMLHQTIADYARTHQTNALPAERLVTSIVPFVEAYKMNHEILEQERDNILATLDFAYALGKQEAFVRIICAFASFLLQRGLYDHAKIHLLRAYHMLEMVDTLPLTITCLHHLGMVAQKQGEYKQATEYYQEGLVLARKADIREQMCAFLSDLGWVTAKRGLYEQAHVYAQDGLSLADQINDEIHRCKLLTVLGVIADNRGEYVQAEAYFQEGLAIAQRYDDKEQQCIIYLDLGFNASERGMPEEGIRFTQIVLQIAKQLKHLEWQCLALLNICAGYEQLGDYKQARRLNEEALFMSKQLGHREWICFSLFAQGALSIRWKSYDQAETSLQEALVLAREIEKPLYECQVLEYLGDLALGRQQVERAEDFFSEMMRKIPEGLFALKAEALYRLGLVAAAKQEPQKAKMLGKEAVRILDELGNKSLEEVRNWVTMDCPPFLPESLTALDQ